MNLDSTIPKEFIKEVLKNENKNHDEIIIRYIKAKRQLQEDLTWKSEQPFSTIRASFVPGFLSVLWEAGENMQLDERMKILENKTIDLEAEIEKIEKENEK